LRARGAKVETLGADELNIDPTRIGLEGSATQVVFTAAAERRKAGKAISGTPDEAAASILGTLLQKGWQRPTSEVNRG